jgi:hypothetical protein
MLQGFSRTWEVLSYFLRRKFPANISKRAAEQDTGKWAVYGVT